MVAMNWSIRIIYTDAPCFRFTFYPKCLHFIPRRDICHRIVAVCPSLLHRLKGRQSLSLSVGYELQESASLVTCETTKLLTQYVEDISNHALTASIGFTF